MRRSCRQAHPHLAQDSVALCVQCPVTKPPLPTITQTAAMIGNTLFLIQNLPAQVGLRYCNLRC